MKTILALLILATWKPEYAQLPQATQDWYRAQTLTPAAEKRIGWHSCCDHADVVHTKFKVGGVGNDEWWWMNEGKWQRIPDDVIHWSEHAPGGEPTLFVYGGVETCFYPPDAGI
jgi:hypothetical protein